MESDTRRFCVSVRISIWNFFVYTHPSIFSAGSDAADGVWLQWSFLIPPPCPHSSLCLFNPPTPPFPDLVTTECLRFTRIHMWLICRRDKSQSKKNKKWMKTNFQERVSLNSFVSQWSFTDKSLSAIVEKKYLDLLYVWIFMHKSLFYCQCMNSL